jgi:hypothetical protein
VLNVLLLHLTSEPEPHFSHPVLAEWEDAACHALQVLAASWDEVDEHALRTALNRLEMVKLDPSRTEVNADAWVFTQLARCSTELSAMIIDVLPDGVSSPRPQA